MRGFPVFGHGFDSRHLHALIARLFTRKTILLCLDMEKTDVLIESEISDR